MSQLSAAPDSGSAERYAGLGYGVTGLLSENLASHPFLVLRRQCQVNHASSHYHRTPFTLLPVLVGVARTQGLSSLWKGIGSSLTVKGLTLAVEDCTSKFTPWPKEVDRHSSPRTLGQHLLLKAVGLAVVSPFFSASLVETVQSEIASERPGALDVFREGLSRVLHWSLPQSGRMLPVWQLLPTTVVHGLAHYIVTVIASGLARCGFAKLHREQQRECGAVSKIINSPGLVQYQEQLSLLCGRLTADVVLFPVETVLHRLHLQGCRTIIDNLDSGREVIPIMTRYEGFFHCFFSVIDEEGVCGLFKGFGALIMQYAVHLALIRVSAIVISEVAKLVNEDSLLPAAPSAAESQFRSSGMTASKSFERERSVQSTPTRDSARSRRKIIPDELADD